ncbi:MAG: 16S rRNA (cytosine(1402)-N(4))-methyltransferase RsmH [Clostridia bacterium]|nr:16S rRNA (cytosine(1402)-N(4))-methyltransferase RsmH [Clostridia bacterium]
MDFEHIPVLLEETITSLNIRPDGIYIDGTAGGGGHSEQIAKRLINGRLLAIDRDPEAVEAATNRLHPFSLAEVVHGNFSDMTALAAGKGITSADGILLDIGVSSHQLDDGERGFSFHKDAPLDMRMSKTGLSAQDVVNGYSEETLASVIYRYGEDKFSRKIASAIVRARESAPIERTLQLAEIISKSVPAAARRDGHPARKTFQALRIEVNGELDCLKKALDDAFELLNVGGVLSVITFHSLEDKIVKDKFNELKTGCTCPSDFPVCVCGKKPRGRVSKPITASNEELEINPRSRSAKLRSVIKLENT